MRKILFILITFVIVFTVIIIPIIYNGLYWRGIGIIWCKKSVLRACPHEVAHYVDDLMGVPSRSPEFREAAESIGLTMWDTQREVYAQLYTITHGKEENMPEQLREFYNWELADKLMEKYNG